MAGEEWELSVFVQEYDSTNLWDDVHILPDTAVNNLGTPTIVTPVMPAFIDLAMGADEALAIIESSLADAEDAEYALVELDSQIGDAVSGFNDA